MRDDLRPAGVIRPRPAPGPDRFAPGGGRARLAGGARAAAAARAGRTGAAFLCPAAALVPRSVRCPGGAAYNVPGAPSADRRTGRRGVAPFAGPADRAARGVCTPVFSADAGRPGPAARNRGRCRAGPRRTGPRVRRSKREIALPVLGSWWKRPSPSTSRTVRSCARFSSSSRPAITSSRSPSTISWRTSGELSSASLASELAAFYREEKGGGAHGLAAALHGAVRRLLPCGSAPGARAADSRGQVEWWRGQLA